MVFAILIWLLLWEVIGRLDLLFLIPPFLDVIKAFANLFVARKFYEALAISVEAFATGVGLAVVIGIPLFAWHAGQAPRVPAFALICLGILVYAALISVFNLLADIALATLDPRIRMGLN